MDSAVFHLCFSTLSIQLRSAPLSAPSSRCFGGRFGELWAFTRQEIDEFVLAFLFLKPFLDALHLASIAITLDHLLFKIKLTN